MAGHETLVRGVVTRAEARETRRRGTFQHRYVVGGKTYSSLESDTVLLARAGDSIEFRSEVVTGSHRYGHRKFHNIVKGSLRLVVTREQAERADGYVYVLTNPTMKGLVKIGYTSDSPEERCRAVSANTGVPVPFTVAWAVPIAGDARLIERAVHEDLDGYREGKEFFRIDAGEAVRAVLKVLERVYPEQADCEGALEQRRMTFERAKNDLVAQREQERATRAREEAEERERRSARLRPPADWNGVPIEVHHPRLRLRLCYQSPSPQSVWGEEILAGRRSLESYDGWRVVAQWQGWLFKGGYALSFRTRKEAVAKAAETLAQRGVPMPPAMRL